MESSDAIPQNLNYPDIYITRVEVQKLKVEHTKKIEDLLEEQSQNQARLIEIDRELTANRNQLSDVNQAITNLDKALALVTTVDRIIPPNPPNASSPVPDVESESLKITSFQPSVSEDTSAPEEQTEGIHETEVSKSALTPTMERVKNYIRDNPGTSQMKDIADALGINKDALGKALKALVEMNVVSQSETGYVVWA